MNPGCAGDRRSEAKHVRPQPNELSEAGGSPFPGERGEGADREIEGPVAGGMRRAERAAPAASGLPCQNSNNSNRPPRRYRLKPIPNAPGWFIDSNVKDAVWKQQDGDLLQRWGRPTGAEAKAAFNLRLNVAAFVEHWGRNHCLFFTVTDEDNLHPTRFARRWNSYLVRNGAWIVSFIRVLEPQKQGRPHYHLLVAVLWDTRADSFDWQAFDECRNERGANGPTPRFRELRARYKVSAASELVALWRLLRKVLPRYGLGRAELLPLRKGKEAISEYVGKYLEAGLTLRRHSWKGCRRVEFDRSAKIGWLRCTRVFAWHSPGAQAWRARVGELGAVLGVADIDGIRRKLGPKWAYRLREVITFGNEEDWGMVLCSLRAEFNRAAQGAFSLF